MKTEERSRHTVWTEDTVWQRVQEHYKSDGCSTQNEFIAKAMALCEAQHNSVYLSKAIMLIMGAKMA